MSSTGNSDIQRILAGRASHRARPRGQGVDHTVAAVITVEGDTRFLPDTVGAVFGQTILPGVVVVVDCSGRTAQALEFSFTVDETHGYAADKHGYAPDAFGSNTVSVQLVGASDARSFSDAVTKGVAQASLDSSTTALWMLHDDSRPADARCLERLLEAKRNTPTASLLGAKQLDWGGENLHDVGSYAGRHRLESLVVDGEPDQEQYDGRQDVYAVSLAGALMPLATLNAFGVNPWFGTFGESADICRRICQGGGRVVVVPSARIAHRRARYEGVRARSGEPLDDDARAKSTMAVLDARQRYHYTDIRMAWWLLLWVLRLVRSPFAALLRLSRKQPYAALCELALPWRALAQLPGAIRARRRVARQAKVPLSKLSVLVANRDQIARWRDREQAFRDQRSSVVLDPLAKAHLRRRRLRRWISATVAALLAFGIVVGLYWDVFREAFSGGSMVGVGWLPTDASFSQLVEAATTSWAFGAGAGVAAPASPWLLVLMVVSVCTIGHVAAATSVIFFLSAPLSVLSFWALAGVFTRSDAVRVACSLLWFSLSLAFGLYGSVNLAMLTVMTFLPAAFAFAFRAVGMYHTEDPVKPHHSIQSAALSALCFIPVVAAEPQLLLPLVLIFLAFLLFVPRHRTMLLMIPLPAAFVLAPTLVNAVHHASDGAWRQLFGDITVPSSELNGSPAALSLADAAARAFGIDVGGGWLSWLRSPEPLSFLVVVVLAVLVLLAIVSLFLPFALRVSRMMWVTTVCGGVLCLVSARVAIAVDYDGQVAGSVLPGMALALLGVLSCVCLVAGGAIRKFVVLRRPSDAEPQRDGGEVAKSTLITVARALLVALLAASTCLWAGTGVRNHADNSPGVAGEGLPMVAVDYLEQGEDHRILAVSAQSGSHVSYTSMRTAVGDLIDASTAQRAQRASGVTTDDDELLASATARLLANADAQAIEDIASLGYGGIYVVAGDGGVSDDAVSQLMANITASSGTQSVVSNASGTYYRLTSVDITTQGIDLSGERSVQSNGWRYAWLWCAGIITALYCVVALPRVRRYEQEEA